MCELKKCAPRSKFYLHLEVISNNAYILKGEHLVMQFEYFDILHILYVFCKFRNGRICNFTHANQCTFISDT